MRPFSLTMQSQALDVPRLGLGLLALASLMALMWTGWALALRAPAMPPVGQCVDPAVRSGHDLAGATEDTDPRCPSDPLPHPPTLREGRAVFVDADDARVTLEIAERPWERARGLMYRTRMPKDRGMVFVSSQRREQSFWTHNTCIPLDLLFIDEDGTIVSIVEDTPTMGDGPIRSTCPSRYVIEVNAGFCRRHRIAPGQRVRLEGL